MTHYLFLLFSYPSELILFYVCACLCCLPVVPFPPVEDGVIEEERTEYEGQYREPELEDPYREQELPEGFEDCKSNPFPFDHIYPSFQTQPVEA